MRGAISSRWTARAVLLGLALLALWAAISPTVQSPRESTDGDTDIDLYTAIVDRMAAGAGYYQAVAAEQPGRGYPLSPTPAVREPLLAWFLAAVGPTVAYAALVGLGVVAVVMTVRCLDRLRISRLEWMTGSLVLALGVAWWSVPSSVWFHDVWAGLLLLTGIMARMSGTWRLAVGAVTLAALVRELAAPVIVLAAVLAWRDGRRMEAMTWCAGGAVFVVFYAWHAVEVADLPSGQTGPGWAALGGWPFATEAIRYSSLLRFGPPQVAAVLVPCAVLGWTAVGRRGALPLVVTGTYLAAFTLVGRVDNAYWGALVAPLLMVGLVLAPRALSQWGQLALPAIIHDRRQNSIDR